MKEGWEYKKLGEVCETSSGGTPSKNNKEYYEDGNIPWLRSGEVAQGLIYKSELFITEKGLNNSSAKLFPIDTIVLAMYGATVGQVGLLKKEMATNQAICGIFPNKRFIPMFLLYSLRAKKPFFMKDAVGGAQPNISQNLIKNTFIPVPPLSEQQRIVEELDLLNSIIEKKKAQLKELDSLAQSIFYDMFGDPVTNEKGWEVKKLGEVCNEIGDGLHGTPQYDPNGDIAFINGNNLIEGKIVITEKTQFVNRTEALKIYIELDSSTIILSINGTLGKIALYNNENIVLGKSACYIKLSDALNRRFVMALMSTHTFKAFLENNSSKSTIKNVGLKAIRNYKIILPPLSLQQQFASKVEAIGHQKELIKQSIKEVETLFNSRMNYYFN